MSITEERLLAELEEAELKTYQSLARYKFVMFGYWAGVWVHINRIGGFNRVNPWSELIKTAQRVL